MQETTSRLRKTFHYLTENDSTEDLLPEALDEEEQESLISTLTTTNTLQNKQYTTILTYTTLVCILPYIRTLFTPKTTLLSILSISSLSSTAYLLHALPIEDTGLAIFTNQSTRAQSQSPITRYLPVLNLVLGVVLFVLGRVVKSKIEGIWWGFEGLPLGVIGVTVLAKGVMRGVDPGKELGDLKYGFKGA